MLELDEKMNPQQRHILEVMCKTKELPTAVFEEYVRIKSMMDRIDTAMTMPVLLMVALRAGYNPETGTFENSTVAQPVQETPLTDDIGSIPQTEKTPVIKLAEEIDEDVKDAVIEESLETPFKMGDKVDWLNEDAGEIMAGTILGFEEISGKKVVVVELDNEDVVKVSEDELQHSEA